MCTQVSAGGWLVCHAQPAVVTTWKPELPPAFVKDALVGDRV
jgi:hypothetical protein